MLYQWHEFQHAVWAPFRPLAGVAQKVLSSPDLPFSHSHYARSLAAACELFERSTRRYQKPEFGLHETVIEGKTVPVREVAVLEKDFCTLKHFRREGVRGDRRLLVVAPLSGHFATLLRGTVEALLPDHEVYITDWTDGRRVPLADGPFGLDDYIDYVIEFLRHLGPGANVVAVCQPAVPVMAAASILAELGDPARPNAMVLMGGPIDTRINPTEVNRLATSRPIEWFEHGVISRVPAGYKGAGRRVYPGFVQLSGFMSQNLDRHISAHLRLFEHLVEGDGEGAEAHRRFYDEYMSVMDLPAEYYLQTVETVFQAHALPRGAMVWRGRKIDPAAISETALLTVEGEFDDISGLGQTRAAHDLCVNIPAERKRHWEQPGVGHYGIFNGHSWREQIYPRVRDFLRDFG